MKLDLSPDLSVASDSKASEQRPARQASLGSCSGTAVAGSHQILDIAAEGAEPRTPPVDRRIHLARTALERAGHQKNSEYSLPYSASHQCVSDTSAPLPGLHSQARQSVEDYSVGVLSEGLSTVTFVRRKTPPQEHTKGSSLSGYRPAPQSARSSDENVTPGQYSQAHLNHHQTEPQSHALALTSNRREHQGSNSRWKGLKYRLSEQMGHNAPQSQSKPKRGERTAGSKVLGALKRLSRSLESPRGFARQQGTAQGSTQVQQSSHPQHQSAGKLEQEKAAPAAWNVTPAHSQLSSPSGAWASPGAASPQPWLYGSPLRGSVELKQWARVSPTPSEPVYDQVPIPRGYEAVHDEGMVAHTPYNVGRHTTPARFAWPHQQPHSGYAGLASPPISQKSPLRNDSVSSLGMGPSPPLGSIDDTRGNAGLGVSVAQQPSVNSLTTWQQPRREDPEAVEKLQGLTQAPSGGGGRARSRGHVNVRDSVSTNNVATFRHSQSPVSNPGFACPKDDKDAAVGVEQHPGKEPSNAGPEESTDGSTRHCRQGLRAKSGVEAKATDLNDGLAAELDDTTERYERSRRLESQEEKILFRAEDADDYQPQMSATSWPGQEWNPYGEPGFDDGRED